MNGGASNKTWHRGHRRKLSAPVVSYVNPQGVAGNGGALPEFSASPTSMTPWARQNRARYGSLPMLATVFEETSMEKADTQFGNALDQLVSMKIQDDTDNAKVTGGNHVPLDINSSLQNQDMSVAAPVTRFKPGHRRSQSYSASPKDINERLEAITKSITDGKCNKNTTSTPYRPPRARKDISPLSREVIVKLPGGSPLDRDPVRTKIAKWQLLNEQMIADGDKTDDEDGGQNLLAAYEAGEDHEIRLNRFDARDAEDSEKRLKKTAMMKWREWAREQKAAEEDMNAEWGRMRMEKGAKAAKKGADVLQSG